MREFILAFIGRAYLHLRFGNKEQVQQELQGKYEGQFRNAGTVLLADIFMALTVVIAVAILAGIVYLLLS